MVSRRLYEVLGLACGFGLLDYGFNFIATGLSGARALTSQFIGANLIIGGSAIVFLALFYLLKPAAPTTTEAQPTTGVTEIGVETMAEEHVQPRPAFYRNIEYIGYFFTFLGLVSAADLVLQVLIPFMYNEARWWVEVLLVTFGVLSYTIFVSIGRLGEHEEEEFARATSIPSKPVSVQQEATMAEPAKSTPAYPEELQVQLNEFSMSPSGELERHLSAEVYDRIRIERGLITIWREDRRGLRSIYLAGPYELSRNLLDGQVIRGEELRIGNLVLSVETVRELLRLQEHPTEASAPSI